MLFFPMAEATPPRHQASASAILLLASLCAHVGASPVPRQAAPAPPPASADLTVVKFAGLAEALEADFYTQALGRFGEADFIAAGFDAGTSDLVRVIQADEATHLAVLQSVAPSLGGSTADLDACRFDFTTALADVSSFFATARVLEMVGVAAYIGGTTLITDKALLVSAAEIATVEARHSTLLNALNGATPIPSPFDLVLSPPQVLSLAAPFVVPGSCDPVAALGFAPTPQLTITSPVSRGATLSFAGSGLEAPTTDRAALFCHIILGGAATSVVAPLDACVVPPDATGPMLVFAATSETPISANIVDQDGSAVVAGPALAFVDDAAAQDLSGIFAGRVLGDAALLGNDSVHLGGGGDGAGAISGQTVIIKQVIIQQLAQRASSGVV